MKRLLTALTIAAFLTLGMQHTQAKEKFVISKSELLNKIKGGWAAQTIGCTYGGPTEFVYQSRMIPDSINIEWPDGRMASYYERNAGLYDDIYMDLTFVDVFERLGLDAPVDSFAMAFANAGYHLWHANQAARVNILNGIMPPLSGDWRYNPHADCIDYQIEADFAGLMSPAMPNQASRFSDRIGHIMNYGNGWYGGVFVGAMYSIAFTTDNIEEIVSEALKTIPKRSTFYKCISDVIAWHKMYPHDWKKTWQLVQDKWSEDIGCPNGVNDILNIDASLNSAYVVMGLLYGEGDFAKTLEISTRCGQDSDCNPATAGGILGTVMGYDKIPEVWMKQCREVEDRNFAHTSISLNKAYDMSYRHALQVIKRNGGKIDGDKVVINKQRPKAVRLEEGFKGLKYAGSIDGIDFNHEKPIEFDGVGLVIGSWYRGEKPDYVADIEVVIDGKVVGRVKAPQLYRKRLPEIFCKYDLKPGHHKMQVRLLNPNKDNSFHMGKISFYDKVK
ncbi:MAG: ADP-ribosylglycohydrolase family protein [Prevotella sp.]|nr:ADP-ribosylglycohydrolase family protein [Prevotella sp.]